MTDLLLIAGPALVASLYLLVRARRARPSSARDVPPNAIVVDGSNVMYWADDTPRIETVREVVRYLVAQGFAPGVVFDANAGYLIAGRYLHDRDFARLLDLPAKHVMVVDKGTPADATILAASRDMEARVVTNDRYRDWVDQHPHLRERGVLVRGGYRDGRLWLDLEDPQHRRDVQHAAQAARR
ncbi:NYN domain-containing protein [Palleronia sp. KMU-117]|uniref:NYN domain-containing protein n=1 Tax=Palleronia sp. KMU-117 TaxID=3434108 RepID=UPI003D70C0FA